MRIIAGLARGRKILPPEGMETRPTLDRIKESIFSIIQNRVDGAIAVDLFAGTGSLGLEIASRGAKHSYLIDKSPSAYALLNKNINNLKFEEFCSALNMDSYEALSYFSNNNIVFDVIFIDPPYAKEMIPPAVNIITEKNLLKKSGIIVTKIDTSETIYTGNDQIILTDQRKYGNTTVCFYKHKED